MSSGLAAKVALVCAASMCMASSLTAAAHAQARVADDAYVADWYCNGGTTPQFRIERSTYSVGNSTERIVRVERRENDFLLTLESGYRASLFDVTATTMLWHSPQSGDTFVCSRFPTN